MHNAWGAALLYKSQANRPVALAFCAPDLLLLVPIYVMSVVQDCPSSALK